MYICNIVIYIYYILIYIIYLDICKYSLCKSNNYSLKSARHTVEDYILYQCYYIMYNINIISILYINIYIYICIYYLYI